MVRVGTRLERSMIRMRLPQCGQGWSSSSERVVSSPVPSGGGGCLDRSELA
jgi:hypothetical protein